MQKQLIPIPLSGGMETKIDPKVVPPNRVINLQNLEFDTGGALRKRYGNKRIGGGTPAGYNALAVFNNELVSLGVDNNVYSLDATANVQNLKGAFQPLQITSQSVIRNQFNQKNPDASVSSNQGTGIQVVAYEDSSANGIFATVFDAATGNQVVPYTQLSAAGTSPRVLLLTTTIVVLWINASGLNAATVSLTNPEAGFTITTGIVASVADTMDAAVLNTTSRIGVVLGIGAANPKYLELNFALAVTQAAANVTGSGTFGTGGNGVVAVEYFPDINELIIFTTDNTNAVHIAAYQGGAALSNGASGVIALVTGFGPAAIGRTAAHAFTVQWEFARSNVNTIQTFTFNDGTGAVTTGGQLTGIWLASKSWSTTQYPSLMVISNQSALQPTFYVTDITLARIYGIAFRGSAGTAPTRVLPALQFFNTTPIEFFCALPVQGQITAQNGQIVTTQGINLTKFDTLNSTQISSWIPAQLGKDLHMTGGMIWDYDGKSVVEHGFPLFPENVTAESSCFGLRITQPAFSVAGTVQEFLTCPAGNQITNSQFVIVYNSITILLYSVNGAAATLSFSPVAGTKQATVNVLSTDTANTVALKTQAALATANPLGGPAVTVTGSTLTISYTANVAALAVPPQDSESLVAFQFNPGSGGTKQKVAVECPGSKYITAGQYVLVQGNTLIAGVPSTMAVWFKVNSVGVAPTVTANAGTLQVSVGANDSPSVVAAAVLAAINAAVGAQAIFVATTPGQKNEVILTDAINGTGAFGGLNINVAGSVNATPNVGIPPIPQWQYSVCYRQLDNQGQTVISAPSVPVSVGNGSAQGISNVTLTIPTLRIPVSKTGVYIDIYRTQVNGSLFYRLTTPNQIPNVTNASTVTYFDTATDDSIIGNDLLYTTGGVLPNLPPGSCNIMVVHQNRIWLAGFDDPNLLVYSQKWIPGNAVQFNDNLAIRVDPRGGPIKALASLDDKLIIFKQNQIWVITGDGPDPSGGGQQFSQPQIISTESGCLAAALVALTPTGVLYLSQKGVYQLDRGLNASYIGAPVENIVLTSDQISIFSTHVARNQVRLFSQHGYTLVYDYLYGQWSQFVTQNGVYAVNWQQTQVWTDGQFLYQENPGFYSDNTTPIGVLIETAWFSPGAIQDYRRFYNCLWLGNFTAGQTFEVDFAYDFIPNASTPVFVTLPSTTGGVYGDSIYGVPIYGASGPPSNPIVEFVTATPRQKCSALKLKITETNPAAIALNFVSLGLEVGVQDGPTKLPLTQSFG